MSSTELKAKLISEITESNNEELLKEVYRLLEIENDDTTPYIFTEEQITMVKETIEEVRAGKFLTDEEAEKEIEEWFEKQP
jgi:hypothetical protein